MLILRHLPDILLLQETRCAQHEHRASAAECAEFGYTIHHDRGTNLAAFTRNGINAVPVSNVTAVVDDAAGAIDDTETSDIRIQRRAFQTKQSTVQAATLPPPKYYGGDSYSNFVANLTAISLWTVATGTARRPRMA